MSVARTIRLLQIFYRQNQIATSTTIPFFDFTVPRQRIRFHYSTQHQSDQPRYNKGFITNLVENIKEELRKNKELQENKTQLEKRIRELHDTQVREKYDKISKETAQSSELIRHKLSELSDYVNAVYVDIKNSKSGQETLKQLQIAVEGVGNAAQAVGNTKIYRHVSYFAEELDKVADVRLYYRPEELKMRTSEFSEAFDNRIFEANTTVSDVELHKDSKWYSGWKSISESQYMSLFMDLKHKFDESEHLLVRAMRTTLERISHSFTSTSAVSQVLTEITKVDPTFDKMEWLRFCELEVIPNILEAWIRMDLTVLEDWCMERAYSPIATNIKELNKVGFHTTGSRIIDVSKVDLIGGEVKDVGPILIIRFDVFMINVVKNTEGKVIEGDQKTPVKLHHVWALCRDLENYNPATAWRIAEIAFSKAPFTI